jgi:hypothetical protein
VFGDLDIAVAFAATVINRAPRIMVEDVVVNLAALHRRIDWHFRPMMNVVLKLALSNFTGGATEMGPVHGTS